MRATATRQGHVEWSVDGRVVGTRSSDEALDWPLTPGTHKVVARIGSGDTAESTFVVR